MRENERIADQLRRSVEGDAWYGPSIREALAGVTAERAAARPIANGHTIWELTLHISAWADVVRRRLEGEKVSAPDEGDFPAVEDTSEEAWQQAVARLEDRQARLREAILGLDASRLDAPVAEGYSSAWANANGAVQHNIYHAGQIAILKKHE